jgi:hypothetical protein
MSDDFFKGNIRVECLRLILFFSVLVGVGCSVEAARSDEKQNQETRTVFGEKQNATAANSINIEPNSPAETIRVFYKNLRERRFREAIFLTNLRPAIEGLTDSELKELEVDFTLLANTVPAEIQINGEIITNEKATVTAKFPNEENGKLELKEFRLAREKGVWLILLVEREAENAIKKEGKNYFFALRLDVYHAEAEALMRQIAKSQMVYSLQNGGLFADAKTLAEKRLLPAEIETAALNGYRFGIALSSDKKSYTATAEPEIYNKTGKLSYLFEVKAGNENPPLKSADNGGKRLKT